MQPRIVVLDGYSLNPGDLSWEALRALGDVTVYERTPPEQVTERLQDAGVAFTNKTPIGAREFAALPALRYVGVLATGYNIVDVAAAKAHGVVVTNIPTYGTDSVAQHAFALILELCHRTAEHAAFSRSGAWSRHPDWSGYQGRLIELAGLTLGIIGFGRIGRRTAEIGAAFGMRVLAHDALQTPPPASLPDFRWADLETLLRASDFVSLHCPLTPDTQGLINRQRLAWMKPTAFLINTSRGPLIVDQDLADALNEGRLAGAGLDVLSIEPPPPDHPLLGARHCLVTPHMAWATFAARQRLMDLAVGNLRAFLEGRPENVVNP